MEWVRFGNQTKNHSLETEDSVEDESSCAVVIKELIPIKWRQHQNPS